MNAASRKVSMYARRSIEMEPGEKKCQWMLGQAERHAVWDWNVSNHTKGIDFYREIVEKNPDVTGPYYYLLDNLIADHRADEAQRYLDKLKTLKDSDPIVCRCYQAHIQLALFDEPGADRIMEDLLKENPDNSICLFEAAQYYAKKCDYQKAIELYELSYEKTKRRPRYTDELHGIADIYKIQGNYRKAVETYDRIIENMRIEWGMKDEVEIKDVEEERARLSTLI
jgi:tetratricopeptide (TPR) repeat protein